MDSKVTASGEFSPNDDENLRDACDSVLSEFGDRYPEVGVTSFEVWFDFDLEKYKYEIEAKQSF